VRALIVTPAPPGSQRGNRITAERWAGFLRELGHEVAIAERYERQECDLLIALHARHSADAIERFAREHPDRPLVVVLTGTDIYGDIETDPRAQRSLELATRLVVLHERGADALPAHLRPRARAIVQSIAPPPRPRASDDGAFTVCVLGHLRPVKDPLRAAAAARLLPASSRVHIVHLGAALDDATATAARAEAETNRRYEWRGELPRAQALEVLASCKLHVLSSAMEGGANALCEALACGIPSLASHIPGSIGLLGSDYPGYFAFGDTGALAALLHRAETDAAFYARLRAACAARAGLVRPERERESLRALLAELVP
jgi:putative glycosyltransferase (TIGR04348 family)